MRLSGELAAELLAADDVAIGMPFYIFKIPSSLEAWVDHVVRRELIIGPDGKGLLGNRKGRC